MITQLDGVVGAMYLKSFAGIYVLAVDFEAAFNAFVVRAAARSALPKIEALTLLLPPPEGPGSGSAEGVGSA